jgi:hypothetical protein
MAAAAGFPTKRRGAGEGAPAVGVAAPAPKRRKDKAGAAASSARRKCDEPGCTKNARGSSGK